MGRIKYKSRPFLPKKDGESGGAMKFLPCPQPDISAKHA